MTGKHPPRVSAPEGENAEDADDAVEPAIAPPPDVQAILDLLGRKRSAAHCAWESDQDFRLLLSGADLSGANLSFADLFGASLSFANLSGADLSRANLRRANLVRADLSGANLTDARVSGAELAGVTFSGTRLFAANFSGAHLGGANFSGADLTGANLADSFNLTQDQIDSAFYRRFMAEPKLPDGFRPPPARE